MKINTTNCPGEEFPTSSEMLIDLGPEGYWPLVSVAFLVLLINLALFFVLIQRFLKDVPYNQVSNLLWVTSLFSAITFFVCLMLIFPTSTEFILATYRVYEALVICRFVELNLMWYGGENQLLKKAGPTPIMSFNTPPCCCCLLCLKDKLLTRRRLKGVRWVVRQMAYVQVLMMFLNQVLYFNGYHENHLTATNPQTYIKIVARVSFMLGFWGLFVFYRIETSFNILKGFRFKEKFIVMKLTLIIFMVQEAIVEVLASRGVLTCTPHMSALAWASIINCSLLLFECSVLGVSSFLLYYRIPKVLDEPARNQMVEMQ